MKTSKYKIKIVCGFRKDQEHTVDANEAHKAYYLFNNPEKRGTFDNGLAIKGSDIQKIVPDYNATMGYNPTHVLKDDDYNEMHKLGVTDRLREVMTLAGRVAKEMTMQELAEPLIDLSRGKYAAIAARSGSRFAQEVLTSGKK